MREGTIRFVLNAFIHLVRLIEKRHAIPHLWINLSDCTFPLKHILQAINQLHMSIRVTTEESVHNFSFMWLVFFINLLKNIPVL